MEFAKAFLYAVGVLIWVVLSELSTHVRILPIIDVSAMILAHIGGGIVLITWCWYVSTIGHRKKDEFWVCGRCNHPQLMWNPDIDKSVTLCPHCKGEMRRTSR